MTFWFLLHMQNARAYLNSLQDQLTFLFQRVKMYRLSDRTSLLDLPDKNYSIIEE